MIMGTWAFMAPEQRADAGVDHLADIYSVGATLFAAVTEETPKDLFAAELDPSLYEVEASRRSFGRLAHTGRRTATRVLRP